MRVAFKSQATGLFVTALGVSPKIGDSETFEVVFLPDQPAPPPPPGVATVNPDVARASIAMLYAKYGLTSGGVGVTDGPYWAGVAVACGDLGYVLDRLEKDILGTGPDTDTPGFGIRRP
jgi:hypothetical protein